MGTSQQKAMITRKAIVEAATRLFQEYGYDAVGIADIMERVGLTNGGFYKHFQSKAGLAAEVAREVFDKTRQRWEDILTMSGIGSIEILFDDYLRVDNIDGVLTPSMFGCASSGDPERDQIRTAFSKGVGDLVAVLAAAIVRPVDERAEQFALASLAAMTGALTIARGVGDPSVARELLMATRSRLCCDCSRVLRPRNRGRRA